MLNLYLSLLHLDLNPQKAKQASLLAQYTAFTFRRRRKCQPISKGYWKKKIHSKVSMGNMLMCTNIYLYTFVINRLSSTKCKTLMV